MSSDVPSLQPAQKVSISAIIPTYNRGHIIERTIRSVLDQTFTPTEILVIDDGSTDDTRTRVTAFGKTVKYIRQENAGASAARNTGVREATCEWVAFLDSDDVWVKTHLERIADAIAKTNGRASFYFADMERPKELGVRSLWQHVGFSVKSEYEFTEDASDWVILGWQPMMLQTSTFNRSKYLECGGLMVKIKVRHDNHLFMKLGLGGPACAVSEYGTIQTYDADPNHLAAAWGSQTPSFWIDTVILNTDILHQKKNLSPHHRRIINNRLAMGYWRLSRFAWKDRAVLPFVKNLLRCIVSDPLFLTTMTKHQKS